MVVRAYNKDNLNDKLVAKIIEIKDKSKIPEIELELKIISGKF